jgi:hypothetical protein
MSYDVHITRAEHWTDSSESPISLDEWIAYYDTDPSLAVEAGGSPDLAVWTGHPTDPWAIWWWHGRIVCKGPDDPMLAKILAIAGALQARVFGDDGEEYVLGPDGSVVMKGEQPAAEEAGPRTRAEPTKSTWLSRLLARLTGS